ncbi:hypothetical protein MPL3365_230072 [Mesorhizobium plurifarium]|uniref:Uncharacterized protein n=1 Tax=Mesorhizobium plurifarium TaxID=69974 RepID=A0A090G4E6_MESPL|nr:hypothetical protein MPL3365_230072 [Mesorhizobium plurifarium]
MRNAVARLVETCNAERSKGSDFPTIWKHVLISHPCVTGQPVQGSGEAGPTLRVPLITGQFLVFLGSHFTLL